MDTRTEAQAPERTPIERHLAFLRRAVFKTQSTWPHYERLLTDLEALAQSVRASDHIVSLERAHLYGHTSLFSPLFACGEVTCIDCVPAATYTPRASQAAWTDDPDCVRQSPNWSASPTHTGLPPNSVDLLLIPNVVHHVQDQDGLFREMRRVLRPGGRGYIFETLLRELHQIPHDYVRYTPWGFEERFKNVGLKLTDWKPGGGPFEAVAYCYQQAVQYLPEAERASELAWLKSEFLPRMFARDHDIEGNQVRPNSSFPLAYGVFFEKP